MITDQLRDLLHTPHPDLHYALWSNLYDSSSIARDLTQTMANVDGWHLLSQIGQLGIATTIILFGILLVFLTSQYEDGENS